METHWLSGKEYVIDAAVNKKGAMAKSIKGDNRLEIITLDRKMG